MNKFFVISSIVIMVGCALIYTLFSHHTVTVKGRWDVWKDGDDAVVNRTFTVYDVYLFWTDTKHVFTFEVHRANNDWKAIQWAFNNTYHLNLHGQFYVNKTLTIPSGKYFYLDGTDGGIWINGE